MNIFRRGLLQAAATLLLLPAAVRFPRIFLSVSQPIPGRVVQTAWVPAEHLPRFLEAGWVELERDIATLRVLVEKQGPLEWEPTLRT